MQNMYKFIASLFTGVILSFALAGLAYAASLSIQIEQPKSPTNQDSFDIAFVALDTDNLPITVTCFKKGPSDGSFGQFGSDISLQAGGNSGKCLVSSSLLNTEGTYQFFARATDGSETQDSTTVSVTFNRSGPGTPTNYSKEKISQCTYRITFKTADDGKTVKVELYRSDKTNFSVDGSTRVESKSIGSNTEGSIENTVADCAKTYYFVIRAFDSASNGSGVVGDSVTTVVAQTTTTPTTGAIAVAKSQVSGQGSVLGKEAEVASQGAILGEATPSGMPTSEETATETPAGQQVTGIGGKKKIALGIVIILIVGGGVYYLYRRFARR